MALYHVTHSGIAQLNGGMGRTYTPPPPTNPPTPPPPVPLTDIEPFIQFRWMAYGSQHTGGVNFAFVDGSARAILPSIDQAVLIGLSSRAGGEPPAW
jgi:prepilin-type processing-associated H-X9-DG protein